MVKITKKINTTKNDTKIPKRFKLHIIGCCLVFFNHHIISSSLSPYLADILLDFGVVENKIFVGYFTGLPTMLFYFSGAFSNYFWAFGIKRFGIKFYITLCQFTTVFVCLLMSICTSFYFILGIFFAYGIVLGGCVPITKNSFGDITPKKQMPTVIGAYIASYNCGTIFSSLISGFLSRPTKQYPDLFQPNSFLFPTKWFLELFPLNIVYVIFFFISVVILIFSLIFIVETSDNVLQENSLSNFEMVLKKDYFVVEEDNKEFLRLKYCNIYLVNLIESNNNEKSFQIFDDNECEYKFNFTNGLDGNNQRVFIELIRKQQDSKSSKESTVDCNSKKIDGPILISNIKYIPVEKRKSLKEKICLFFKNESFAKLSFFITLLYVIIGFTDFLLNKAIPVFFSLSISDRGLGFQNYEIGIILNIAALISFLLQITQIIPFILKVITPIWFLRIYPIILIPIIPLLPELNYLLKTNTLIGRIFTWILIIVYMFFKNLGVSAFYTSILIIINNSVHVRNRSLMQSISYFFVSLSKGFGPVVGNLGLSIGSAINVFPFDIHFFFLICSFFFLILSVFAFFLPVTLKMSRELAEKNKDDIEIQRKRNSLSKIAYFNVKIPNLSIKKKSSIKK